MKRQLLDKIIFILFLLPIHLFAQPASPANIDITGLWKGSLYNDTTQKNLPYEIAISEEKGKLSGYSYTLFDIDGKKELGVKRIKIKRKDDQLIIEDVALILNNYSEPPPRKVRQQSVVNLLVNDTAMQLAGKWNTNQTREYRPLTGSLQLQRALDYRPLVLYKKLVELELDKELSFVKAESKREADIAINKKQTTEINLPAAAPSQSADAGKTKEITAPVTEKKTEVVVENKPADKEIKPSGEPVAKFPVDKPKETAAPVPEKKTVVAIAANETAKKGSKPSEQSIVNAPPDGKLRKNISQVAGKKTTSLVVKDSVEIKTKPPDELVKKVTDKPKTIIAPATEKKKEVVVAANDRRKENIQSVFEKPKPIIPPPATKKSEPVAAVKEPAKKENKPSVEIVKAPVTIDKPTTITAPEVNNKIAPDNVVKEPIKTKGSTTTVVVTSPQPKKELPVVVAAPFGAAAAANVSERKMNKVQSVFFESDSLVLTLYDNGEVDGDTVSVLMNGQIIFAKQGLSTKANSKTIYVDKAMQDSLSLIMYAENLGSIPPNTGLLIIMDGEKRYEVRFSADLQTNAGILLRRRIKEK